MVERLNAQVGDAIRIHLQTDDRWHTHTPAIAWAIRVTHHRGLNTTPARIIFGVDMLEPHLQYNTFALQQEATARRQRQQTQDLDQRNKKRLVYQYRVGQQVLVKFQARHKEDPRFTGPYYITGVHGNNTVTIQGNNAELTLNITKLKPIGKRQDVVPTI